MWRNVTFLICLSFLSVIWTFQWFLVHWSIISTQNSCNWIVIEYLKILSKKNSSFPKFSPKITQIYIQFCGEWAPICRYQKIEAGYTLETWDYYKDYICAHKAKNIKEIAQELTLEKCFASLTSVTHWLVNDCNVAANGAPHEYFWPWIGLDTYSRLWQQGPASFNITAKTDVCTLPINMPKLIIVHVRY